MDSKYLDPQLLTDKENIRKNIRNGLASKRPTPAFGKDAQDCQPEPIDDLFLTFITNFRKAGGKYIPCTTQNMVQYLVKIAQGQQYTTVLNTSPNLANYLNKYKVRYVSAINANEPVDAVICFTDVLIARTGAVGFTQSVSQYASIRNLAKDIIVVSRARCIFQDVEDALRYQSQRNGGKAFPMTEFLTPTAIEEINGKPQLSPLEPRIILMLIEEPQVQAPTAEVQTSAAPQTQPAETQPSAPTEAAAAPQQNSQAELEFPNASDNNESQN